MELSEHKAILTELMSDTIDSKRKTELLMKIGDDYGITHATLTDTTKKLEKTTEDKEYFENMSKKLWLENSAQLTNISTTDNKKTEIEQHAPKMTLNDLMSKF